MKLQDTSIHSIYPVHHVKGGNCIHFESKVTKNSHLCSCSSVKGLNCKKPLLPTQPCNYPFFILFSFCCCLNFFFNEKCAWWVVLYMVVLVFFWLLLFWDLLERRRLVLNIRSNSMNIYSHSSFKLQKTKIQVFER